uniref:Malectin-like domain-containing protein n=1 Tax=Nelumbo nucifera TaxID=4432 RepID=A0A822ZBX0_NELNU|nr:TPA_asm: hypothetical protein HUJ06_015494 [Nelumbo nucifera]
MTNPDQRPFISAIEVRSLDFGMYDFLHPNYAFLATWKNYGKNSTQLLRYPEDPYDRYWEAEVGTNLMPISVGSDTQILAADLPDKPPQSVLQTALTILNSSGNGISLLNYTSTELYINLYFAELLQLNSSQKRSFNVYTNNVPLSQQPIIPPYLSALQVFVNINVSSATVLSLSRTRDSTLPPLINAMELFEKNVELTDGTFDTDVKALALLQSAFSKLQEWRGDPCLPESFTWDWVECSNDKMPRISKL